MQMNVEAYLVRGVITMPNTDMIEIGNEFVHYETVIDEENNVITVSLPDYPPYSSSTHYYKSYKPAIIEHLVKSLYYLNKLAQKDYV
jgi:hypothetical protein